MSILFEIMKSLKPTLMTVAIALAMFASVAIVNANTPEKTQIKRLIIGPHLVDCTGMIPQKCLQILNPKTGKFENLFGEIQGFNFVPGSKSLIEVQETIRDPKNTPADMSTVHYSLIRIIKSRSSSSMIQGSWKITALNGENVVDPAYVNFLGGDKISARICNIFSGNYSLRANALNVSNLVSTKMACMGELGDIENRFYLDSAKVIKGKDGLSLTTKKGDVFILKNQDILLKNTSWKLENKDSVKPTNEITLHFSDTNTLSLKSCNVLGGEYTLINNTISAPNLISTMMYCDDERGQIENDFHIDGSIYSLENDILTIITPEGKKFVWSK